MRLFWAWRGRHSGSDLERDNGSAGTADEGEIAADVAMTIALWQREGLTPWAAWLTMGRLGEASSWAVVAGWMIWHMRQNS